MSVTQQQPIQAVKVDEQILVVKRSHLFPQGAWQGMYAGEPEKYEQLVRQHHEFFPRSLMEQDPTYKQIIPYLVFTHNGRYFLMQRHGKITESRLVNKYSLGIGGHINAQDITNADIASWAAREFEEEVNFNGTYRIEPLGILNDDSNSVGEVHVGFVYLLHGTSSEISVRDEHKEGRMLTLQECAEYYDAMESWTQIVFKHLQATR